MGEPALARRGQRRLVKALRVGDAPLYAGDLGVGQRRPTAEVIGALPGPLAEPAGVRDEGVPVPRAILGRDLVVARGVGQRGVEVVLGGLEELGRRPEERRRIFGGRHGGGEVVCVEAGLQLADPVPAGGDRHAGLAAGAPRTSLRRARRP